MPAWARSPVPVGLPPAQPYRTSAEHGTLTLDAPGERIRVGDAFDCIVGHGDATVFLHDWLVAARRGVVEAIWEVTGRGKLC